VKPVNKLSEQIRQLVESLGEDQLHELLHLVSDRLRLFHKARALYAMKDFQVFDRVYFDYRGERKEGTVTRLNQKTISVRLINGESWKVAPDFLIKIIERN